MANTYPTSKNNYTGNETLSAAGHAQAHNAYESKIGTGASTPTLGKILKGTGTGTSAWSDPTGTGGGPTLMVAASNANSALQARADYVCTGTNDHTTINSALNALPASGGKVVLTAGTYLLGGSIVMKSYQRMEGAGKGTIITPSAGSTYDLIIGSLTPTFNRYVELQSFKVDCTNQTSGNAINIYAPRNNLYRSLWFTAVKGSCINLQGDTSALGWYNWVLENEIDGVAGSGITAPAYCEQNYILFNTITFVTGQGIYCASDLDTIAYNMLDACTSYSIHVFFGAGLYTIVGNKIDRPGTDAIYLEGADKTLVMHNFIGGLAANKAGILNGPGGGNNGDKIIIGYNRQTETGASGSVGYKELGATSNCIITNNQFAGPATAVTLNVSSTGLFIRNNQGYVTEAQGTATVANGQTTIAVTHGLSRTPTAKSISVTPTNNLGTAAKFWITSVGATTFTITVDADPGSGTATFAWTAAIY